MLKAYASRTGTRRNLALLREKGWRLMVSATGCHRNEGFSYAIDNGAWTNYQQGRPFDPRPFERLLDSHGAGADWAVLPDIVAGGLYSLRMSLDWLKRVQEFARYVLLPVQNGMTSADVEPHVGGRVGIFVGGDDVWKEKTMPIWGELAERRGCLLHVGRVNTARRIKACQLAGAHSFDGTSGTRWAVTIDALDNARRREAWHDEHQICLPFGLARGSPDE